MKLYTHIPNGIRKAIEYLLSKNIYKYACIFYGL